MAGEKQDTLSQKEVSVKRSWFWDMMAFVWGHIIRPLAKGIVYGSGTMLGACIIRYYVMGRFGFVPYKEFKAPPGTVPLFELSQ